ncbi:MAG: hypothetical protein EBR30_11740 [Cytophagia bacterium]|nr:hypothetical protein [Cytophagia bacterium]
MSILFIVLLSLWVYPLLTYFLIKLSRHNKFLRNRIAGTTLLLIILITISLSLDISTTSIEVDWVLITIYYFGICLGIWRVVESGNKLIKISGYILMILFFGLGYFLGTIGVLGVGFAIGEYVPRKQNKITNCLSYKEIGLGNAVSDYRGLQVEIFEEFKYIPFIEKRVSTNRYFGMDLIRYEMIYTYDARSKTLHLKLNVPKEKNEDHSWAEKIKVD